MAGIPDFGDGPAPGQPGRDLALRGAARAFRLRPAAEKNRVLKTLKSVSGAKDTDRTELRSAMVWQLKSATEHDMTVGGADLAGRAIKGGLVDELQLFLVPAVVPGGKRALPNSVRSDLELPDTQRFASGAVYRCRRWPRWPGRCGRRDHCRRHQRLQSGSEQSARARSQRQQAL
jgi:hypothetical protein